MSKTVLIVEDNELSMKLINDLLQAKGFNTLKAGDGLIALDIAREQIPDLIIMDIQLPDISGHDVIRKLKSDDKLRKIPVIAVTALALKGDKEMCLEAGCDFYISKPISVPDFLKTIATFLD